MQGDFQQLKEVNFSKKLQPEIEKIFQHRFPHSEYKVNTNIEFDRDNAIDGRLYTQAQQTFTVQSKVREHKFLINPSFQVSPPYPDFTQEFKNASGTQHESEGEYFHNDAQLYFYGWANADNAKIQRFIILYVSQLKMFYEKFGIQKFGKLRYNKNCGKASFYCISIQDLFLFPSIIMAHNFTMPLYKKQGTIPK